MIIDLVNRLKEAGVEVTAKRRPAGDFDAFLDVDVDGIPQRFAVEIKMRAPYPNELDTFLAMHDEISAFGAPLLLAPSISDGVGRRLVERGWSWADARGNIELRADGIRLKQRVPNRRPVRPGRALLPQGPGSLAIIRFLIREANEWTTFGPTELANIARVKQPRASQVLSRLQEAGLVERTEDGWRADREALLGTFLNEYRGPGGAELFFYSLDASPKAALDVVNVLTSQTASRIALSADIGPDLIKPWRSPTVAVIYIEHEVDTSGVELVAARSREDANVLLRIPDDVSLFRFPPLEADVAGSPVSLADETQMIWDLHDLGGDDRIEAAGELKKWLLAPR